MIDCQQGIYGGYTLMESNLLGVILDKKEIAISDMIKEQLVYNNDMNKDEFTDIVGV